MVRRDRGIDITDSQRHTYILFKVSVLPDWP